MTVPKRNNLTLRQAQALMSISYRLNVFGFVTLGELISDMGVAFATLANHLERLQKQGLITTPDNNRPHNLAFQDKIQITPQGEITAQKFLAELELPNYNNCNPASIFEKLRNRFEKVQSVQLDLFLNSTTTASFAKAFEKIVAKNPTEPILTAIAMYTDLDSQLSLMKLRDRKKYKILSSAKLNIEVRNGRLASMAIPTALRAPSSLKASDLWRILENSWSWMGTVDRRSRNRYWQEANSLGLMQANGELLTSMKPTAIDTISWLANKTHFTFINTIPIAPKCSLVLFKESFNFPTLDDLYNPQNANLPWLSSIRENMQDKSDYIKTIKDGLRLVMDDVSLLQLIGDRVIPSTVIRMMSTNSEMTDRFNTLMKNDSTQVAKILIAISAKPGITVQDLYSELKNKSAYPLNLDDVWQSISILATNKLVHYANSKSVESESTRLFSFIHLPYIDRGKGELDETNAVLRGIKPYLLQLLTELFETKPERDAAKATISNLMNGQTVLLDEVEREYDATFMRKMLVFCRSTEPFVKLDSKFNMLTLNQNNFAINKILLDSLLYSLVTQDEGMGIYATTIANLVEKDAPWASRVENEVKALTNELIQQGLPSRI